jgi:hypothetical protein
LEYASNSFYIFEICLVIFFCSPINIGPPCNLYSAVDVDLFPRGYRIILTDNCLNNLYYLQCLIVDAEAVFIVFQKKGYFDDTKRCSSSKSKDSLDLVDIQI